MLYLRTIEQKEAQGSQPQMKYAKESTTLRSLHRTVTANTGDVYLQRHIRSRKSPYCRKIREPESAGTSLGDHQLLPESDISGEFRNQSVLLLLDVDGLHFLREGESRSLRIMPAPLWTILRSE